VGDYAKRMERLKAGAEPALKRLGMKARRKRKNAKQEILKDDARGFRKRVANAKRIKGETTAKAKGFARNPGALGKLIEDQQRKKPY